MSHYVPYTGLAVFPDRGSTIPRAEHERLTSRSQSTDEQKTVNIHISLASTPEQIEAVRQRVLSALATFTENE